MHIVFLLLKDFIYLFLERGEGREKERERNSSVWLPLVCPPLGTWPATQACDLTGNRTGDPLVHRLAFNPLSTPAGAILRGVLRSSEGVTVWGGFTGVGVGRGRNREVFFQVFHNWWYGRF